MQQDGLREVSNPSELLLSSNRDGLSGIAIAAAVEGVRPLLIEVQALVASAAYGTPQRSSTGFDGRRLNMLLAVLEKRVGFKLLQKDVFVKRYFRNRATQRAVRKGKQKHGKIHQTVMVGHDDRLRAYGTPLNRLILIMHLGTEKDKLGDITCDSYEPMIDCIKH
jgi:hypothetical protein